MRFLDSTEPRIQSALEVFIRETTIAGILQLISFKVSNLQNACNYVVVLRHNYEEVHRQRRRVESTRSYNWSCTSTPESLRGEKAKDNSGILYFTIFYSLLLGYEFSGLFYRFE